MLRAGLGLCVAGALVVALADAWLSWLILLCLDSVEADVGRLAESLRDGGRPEVTGVDLRRDRRQNLARALKTLGWLVLAGASHSSSPPPWPSPRGSNPVPAGHPASRPGPAPAPPPPARTGDPMKLSHAAADALRALVFLAGRQVCGLVRVDVIAARLPLRFLSKTLGSLVSAGSLYAERGRQGGFRLAKPAGKVTLLEVVEAIDGPVRGESPRVGNPRLNAQLQQVCDGIAGAVRDRLRRVTVADLANGAGGPGSGA
jgi:Rrf2 family protein